VCAPRTVSQPAGVTSSVAAAAPLLPGLDWPLKLAIGLPVLVAGFWLLKPPRQTSLRFALGIFTIEVGTLIAIRGIVAINPASWWQYLLPFALVLVPGLFVAVVLTRLGWWRLAGFTHPRAWRSPMAAIPLILSLALPAAGLWAHGIIPTTAMILTLQVGFLLIDVSMEEIIYRGVILEALRRYGLLWQIGLSSVLFGFSHIDNLFLPGSDPVGVWYQIFEAILIGVLFASARLRMKTIWAVLAIHAIYDFMLVLAFGHAFPVAPTPAGFAVDTVVNLCLAGIGLLLVMPRRRHRVGGQQAA
jgi:membrane protease YdiL (CAAX protease family)